jgi:hypothetical protein
MCNELFATRIKNKNAPVIQQVKHRIMKENESNYFQYRNLITAGQWHLLKAIANEETLQQPYNKTIISQYNSGSASIVKRSLDALLQKELIYIDHSAQEPFYAVYDKFFMRWLQHLKI